MLSSTNSVFELLKFVVHLSRFCDMNMKTVFLHNSYWKLETIQAFFKHFGEAFMMKLKLPLVRIRDALLLYWFLFLF